MRAAPKIAAMSNPAPGGLLQGVIGLGLMALGVTGVVMGMRVARPRETHAEFVPRNATS